MEIGKEVRDLSQGPKNVYFVDTARKSLLECSYFLCLSKECKDYNYLIAINYVFVSVAWQALTMQILFKLNFMIAIYIFWAMLTILSFSMWFIVRLAWIQNTSDKNECFWACLIGTFIIQALLVVKVGGFEKPKTTVPTEKVKITISSNIPKDSIELVIRSINETHSTDLP